MARIFVSYAREDQPIVSRLAEGLRLAGHTVWWDSKLEAAEDFREAIELQLADADVILVVWSQRARQSRYVLDEAEHGVRRGVLLPVRVDEAPAPLGFGVYNALDFANWGGNYKSASWRRLLGEVRRVCVAPTPSQPRPALRVWPKAATVAVILGTAIGLLVWRLYVDDRTVPTSSMLGHPLVDAIVLSVATSLPVAICAATETRRAGFEGFSLILRRSLSWFFIGGALGLLVVALAAASGVVEASTPERTVHRLSRAFITVSVVSACLLASARLAWITARGTANNV